MKTAKMVVCGILSVLLCAVAFGAEQIPGDNSASDNKMGYINPDAKLFPYPAYKGKYYEDKVPDTIDIAEMAKLTINGITGSTDPNADHGMYFSAGLSDMPGLQHNGGDLCQCKFMEALPLLRIVSGSDLNKQVDRVWMDSLLKSIGPDGLYYVPLKGWPWLHADEFHNDLPIYRPDGTTIALNDPSVTQVTYSWVLCRMLDVMMIHYQRDRNPAWKEMGKKIVDRLVELCIDKGDYAYLPKCGFIPNAQVTKDACMPIAGQSVLDFVGRMPEGLGKYYKLTGYEPAKTLAKKIANFMRYHADFYDDQGYAKKCDTYEGGHFHSHTIGLLSILEYATAAGDREAIEYVNKAFDWWKKQGCTLTGYFPELLEALHPEGTCETCEIADMIALGLKLTDVGMGDYWDDVDRWIRNQFAENQLTRIDWVNDISPDVAAKASEGFSLVNASDEPGGGSTSSHAAERVIGSFAGWSPPNDWGVNIMHCCTGNAGRSIYYVWEHMLDAKDGRLRVNLLMNRASQWADVYSYIPYEGKVGLKIKKSFKNVLVRMPEWVKDSEKSVKCTVNGKARNFKWKGRYVDLGSAKAADKVTMSFPIHEWTTQQKIGGKDYNLVVKGSTVVSVDPPGTGRCPTYQRARYRQNKAHWKTVKRFVSSEHLEW